MSPVNHDSVFFKAPRSLTMDLTLNLDIVKKSPNNKSLYIFCLPPCDTNCRGQCEPQDDCIQHRSAIDHDLGMLIGAIDDAPTCYLEKVFIRNADSMVSLGKWRELARYLQKRLPASQLHLEIHALRLPAVEDFMEKVKFMIRVEALDSDVMNIHQYEAEEVGLSYHLTDGNYEYFLDLLDATYQKGYAAEVNLSLNVIGKLAPRQLTQILSDTQSIVGKDLTGIWLSPLRNLVARARSLNGLSCYRKNVLTLLKTGYEEPWYFTHELPTHFLCQRCDLDEICDKSILFYPSDLSARRHCNMYRVITNSLVKALNQQNILKTTE